MCFDISNRAGEGGSRVCQTDGRMDGQTERLLAIARRNSKNPKC